MTCVWRARVCLPRVERTVGRLLEGRGFFFESNRTRLASAAARLQRGDESREGEQTLVDSPAPRFAPRDTSQQVVLKDC